MDCRKIELLQTISTLPPPFTHLPDMPRQLVKSCRFDRSFLVSTWRLLPVKLSHLLSQVEH